MHPDPPPTIIPQHARKDLKPHTLYVMAAACGVSVANIYYNSPLLADFQRYFNTTADRAGMVATAAQVGYGVGLLFFVPLGDIVERRRVVLIVTVICTFLLLVLAASPTLNILILTQFLVGVTATSAQLLIPFGIDLAPAERRGHTVGVLMAGLLTGLLGARVVAGFVGDHLGWRAMFVIGAGLMAMLAVVLHLELPHRAPTNRMSYAKLMRSLIDLPRQHPQIWPASLVSGLSFGSFMAFWTALSFLMLEQFNRGASEAGLFGIVALIGVFAAPWAGKLSDSKGPTFTVWLCLLLSAIAFVLMWGWVTIASLIIGVLLMDIGVQCIQVACQSKVMSLAPDARSRINTLYMVMRFIGGAAGSMLGALAWSYYRWPGVCGVAIALTVVAAIIHLVGTLLDRRQPNTAGE